MKPQGRRWHHTKRDQGEVRRLPGLRKLPWDAGIFLDEIHPFLDQLRPIRDVIEPRGVQAIEDPVGNRFVCKAFCQFIFSKRSLVIERL